MRCSIVAFAISFFSCGVTAAQHSPGNISAGFAAMSGDSYSAVVLGESVIGVTSGESYSAYAGSAYTLPLSKYPTSTEEGHPGDLPSSYSLAIHASSPNPAPGPVTIRYELAKTGPFTLEVYNLLGKKISDIASGTSQAGNHVSTWDPQNVASGVYVCRLKSDGAAVSRTITIIR